MDDVKRNLNNKFRVKDLGGPRIFDGLKLEQDRDGSLSTIET